ncbi:MAG: hypothetical protein WCF65_06070 [Parachlamydiaceae bacterium]
MNLADAERKQNAWWENYHLGPVISVARTMSQNSPGRKPTLDIHPKRLLRRTVSEPALLVSKKSHGLAAEVFLSNSTADEPVLSPGLLDSQRVQEICGNPGAFVRLRLLWGRSYNSYRQVK